MLGNAGIVKAGGGGSTERDRGRKHDVEIDPIAVWRVFAEFCALPARFDSPEGPRTSDVIEFNWTDGLILPRSLGPPRSCHTVSFKRTIEDDTKLRQAERIEGSFQLHAAPWRRVLTVLMPPPHRLRQPWPRGSLRWRRQDRSSTCDQWLRQAEASAGFSLLRKKRPVESAVLGSDIESEPENWDHWEGQDWEVLVEGRRG
jgi:hypothetical protein